MTIINFTCPECGHSMQLPATLAGKNGKCPKCQKDVLVVGELGVASSLPKTTQPLPTQPQVPQQQQYQQPPPPTAAVQQPYQQTPQQPVAPTQQQYQQPPPTTAVQQQYQQTPQQSVAPIQHSPTPTQQHPPHQQIPITQPSVQAPLPPNSASTNGGGHSSETHNQMGVKTHDRKSIRGLIYKIVAGVVGVTGIAGVLAIGLYFYNEEGLDPREDEVFVQLQRSLDFATDGQAELVWESPRKIRASMISDSGKTFCITEGVSGIDGAEFGFEVFRNQDGKQLKEWYALPLFDQSVKIEMFDASNDYLILNGNSHVLCFNQGNLDEVWDLDFSSYSSSGVCNVTSEYVLIKFIDESTDPWKEHIHCVSLKTGATLWKFIREDAVLSNPYFSPSANMFCFGFKPRRDADIEERSADDSYVSSVIGLAANSGEVLWETVVSDYGSLLPDEFESVEGMIISGIYDTVYVFNDQTGEMISEKEFSESQTILGILKEENALLLSSSDDYATEIASIDITDLSENWSAKVRRYSVMKTLISDSEIYVYARDFHPEAAKETLLARGIQDYALQNYLSYSGVALSIDLSNGETNWKRDVDGSPSIFINKKGETFILDGYRDTISHSGANSFTWKNGSISGYISEHHESSNYDELLIRIGDVDYLMRIK